MILPPLLLAVSFLPFFEARNQVANFVIEPPRDGTVVKPALPDLMVHETCPSCSGKGELALEEPDYGQAKGRLGAARKVRKECPLCRGKGKVHAFMNPSQLALQVAADRAAFAAEHQGRGEIAVGEAFVPNEVYQSLDKERRKLVAAAFGQPCKKCNWTGLEACKTCKGNGVVACRNNDCKGGWSVVKTTTETSVRKSGGSSSGIRSNGGFRSNSGSRSTVRKETKINVSPCAVCGGARFTVCPDCGGR
ncbi:MAG: hypothetical protein IJ829_07990, partial [Kiritimatiellae bacterium]|nr:hypothetical protein [Kiritimatiellia bacterium]